MESKIQTQISALFLSWVALSMPPSLSVPQPLLCKMGITSQSREMLERNRGRCSREGLPQWSSGKESLPMQETKETQVPSLCREDPLEEGMETHASILAWEIPWTEESGGLQSIGLQTGQDSSDLACTHAQEGERGSKRQAEGKSEQKRYKTV